MSETLSPVKGHKISVSKNRKKLVEMFGMERFSREIKKLVNEVKNL